MEKITEISQSKRLKEFGINIKTKYRTRQGLRERNSDQSLNQNVSGGIRVEKKYYRNGAVIHRTRSFDSRILYTFVADDSEQEEFVCPNCGAVCRSGEAEDGCPYCGTHWNLDYSHRDMGSKYTYDRTMHDNRYLKITLGIDLVISFLVAFHYIVTTSRTFYAYDVLKILLYGLTLAAMLFYVFYYMDALVVLLPIKWYKDRLNGLQREFWKRMEALGIEKEKFYNNFNYEISQYYFRSREDVIDYDILDYNTLEDFQEDGRLQVRVNATIRVLTFLPRVNRIRERTKKQDFLLAYQGPARNHLKGGMNRMVCRGCGASIDATADACPYCGTRYGSFQEWFLVDPRPEED